MRVASVTRTFTNFKPRNISQSQLEAAFMQMGKQIVIQGIFKTIKGMFKNYKRNIL